MKASAPQADVSTIPPPPHTGGTNLTNIEIKVKVVKFRIINNDRNLMNFSKLLFLHLEIKVSSIKETLQRYKKNESMK